MQITAPFGYGEIVPFVRDQRVRLIALPQVPDFARASNSLPVTMGEAGHACHDYPLAFVKHGASDFALVAVVGIADRENLFVNEAGWLPGYYAPAYVRRFPFCMTRVSVKGKQQARRMICVDKSRIDPEGTEFFGADDKPIQRWVEIEQFLNDYELDLENTMKFCNTLRDFKLLAPITLQAVVAGQEMTLSGMYGIDTNRMATLNSSEIKTLFKSGALATIFLQLSSTNRFTRLIEMKSARTAALQPAAAPLA